MCTYMPLWHFPCGVGGYTHEPHKGVHVTQSWHACLATCTFIIQFNIFIIIQVLLWRFGLVIWYAELIFRLFLITGTPAEYFSIFGFPAMLFISVVDC